MGALLGFIGAAMGSSGAFGFSAAVGWFIGSTIGSLLSLENSHVTAGSGRITDFKAYNSKYGIPISKGYGCVRFAGNLIWRSPVEELETINTQCIRSGGFFGIGGSKSCVHTSTFQYRQSGAIAFCEGPAASILKIWADGQLVWNRDPTSLEEIRSLTSLGLASGVSTDGEDYGLAFNQYNPYNNCTIRTYLGTTTQDPDPLIAQALSATYSESGLDEVYAFRNIVYIMVDSIDLEPWGNRMPTFTAEVCFNTVEGDTVKYLERSALYPTTGINSLGMVTGLPNLLVGMSVGTNQMRQIFDVRTQEILFEDYGAINRGDTAAFSSSYGHLMLSPDLKYMTHSFPFSGGSGYAGPADFLTGRVQYLMKHRAYLQVGLSTPTYDPVRNGFWNGAYLTGDMGWYPIQEWLPLVEKAKLDPNYKEGVDKILAAETTTYVKGVGRAAVYGSDVNENQVINDLGYVFRSGRQLPEDWDKDSSIPGGLQGRTNQQHVMKDGKVIWMTTSFGLYNVWLMVSELFEERNIYTLKRQQQAYRVKDWLGRDLSTSDNFCYIAIDDSVVIAAADNDVAQVGTSHLYKVYISEFDDINHEIILPEPGTAGRHIACSIFDDEPAYQRGPFCGGTFAVRGSEEGSLTPFGYMFVDGVNMKVVEQKSLLQTGISLGVNTLYFPNLHATVQRPNGVVFWGPQRSDALLSDIVTDLMTQVDGEQLAYLTPADIDVSELTDRVRGFSITRQQTIRGSITQLMQGFFFDSVEGDGKIKFKKRGRASSFSIPEDDLRAVDYGTVKNRASSVEYERMAEREMPRELVVNYPDIDSDYLQVSQRARRIATEADSNIGLAFQIVFNKDEAAQVADILLFDAWQERNSNYQFIVSTKHILIEPGDVGTITMDDGRIHRLRIVSADLGASGVTEFIGVEDFENSYLSNAVGMRSQVAGNTIEDRAVMPIMVDVTTRFLPESLPGTQAIVAGITSMGASFDGGKLIMQDVFKSSFLAGAKGPGQGPSWGAVSGEIGHPNAPLATNVFDTETTIPVNMVGGDFPVSGTTAEALAGERLMLIDNEIIGYTTVVSPDQVKVEGTDISFAATGDTIDSVSTDFVAAGFTVGMHFYVKENSPQSSFYWEVDTVSANQIKVTGNITVTQAAGPNVLIQQAGRRIVISNLLRGLYGTQNFRYHRNGARVYFPENLFAVPITPPEPNNLVKGYASSIFGGDKIWGSVIYRGRNTTPWPPTNLGYSAGSITWDRMDQVYSDGIDPAVPTDLGEAKEEYLVRHLDHNTAGEEGTILSEIRTEIPSTSQISVTSLPVLVDVHQTNNFGILSEPLREVVSSDGSYSGGGDIDQMGLGTVRWNTQTGSNVKEAIITGPYAGNTALRFLTTSAGSTRFSGLEMATGAVRDIEILTRVYPNLGSLSTGIRCGVYLRGTGVDTPDEDSSAEDLNISSAFIGFGSSNASTGNRFQLSLFQNAQSGWQGILPDLDDEVEYDWGSYGNFGMQFWIRARVYGNRFQARVWKEGETEPSSWQLDAYDDTYGPYFGSAGFFATNARDYQGLYSDYFSWAHRGGTAP